MTGTQMTFVALPWFVLVTTGSVSKMSFVLAAEILPMAIFGIPSGSVIARFGARRTMLFSDLFRAPLMVLVPLLHWTGGLSFAELLVIVFVLGLFTAPYFAAMRTIIPEVYGDDERLVSKVSAALGGAAPVLLVDAATYLVAFVLVLVFVRGGKPVPHDENSRGVLAGVRFLTRDRILGPITLTVILLDAAAAALFTSLPALAYLRFGQDPKTVGWLFAAFGIGALGGSVLAMKALDHFSPLRLAGGAMVLVVLPLWALVATLPWE